MSAVVYRAVRRRNTLLRFCSAFAMCVAGSQEAQTQSAVRPVNVTGFAFDSLHGVPLANAFVMIEGRSRSATSDAKGKFTFDTLPPGTYTFAMQHAVFDSLGLSGATTRAVVTDGKAVVTLAVPSFPTMWRALCGAIPVPVKDSGVVYGSVRDAKKQEFMPQATVEVSWLDLVNLGTKDVRNITQRRWRNESQSDARGSFAVCGVPVQTQLRLRASYLTNATGPIDLPASADRVRRRDLMVAGTLPGDTALRGAIAGVVVDPSGRPIAGARIIVDDSAEVRADMDGKFALRDARTGTRQVDITAIGMSPFSVAVDVPRADSAFISATLRTVTNLEAVNVTASTVRRRAAVLFDERRKQGFGSYLDSTSLATRGTLSSAFAALPGVTVQGASANGRRFNLYLPSTGIGQCLAMLQVDGIQQFDHEILGMMSPQDIAAIEVYPQRTTVPTELMRTDARCGLVAVWTKRMFR